MHLNKLGGAIAGVLYGGALLGLTAMPAQAQESSDEVTALDRIQVTGSRIKRVDIETSQPVFVMERKDLQATGLTQVGDILQDLAVAGASLNQVFNNGGNGSTSIDLREVGPQSTLVLVNGRRYAPDGRALSGQVDLNSIPTSMIERIEILKDGASTIYGSDAIAGVINIITINSFDGMQANAYFGEASEGDGRTEAYDFTAGSSSDNTSIVVSLSYQKNEPIFAGDRAISAVPQFGADFCASSTSPNGRFGLAGRSGTFTLTDPSPTGPGVVQNPNNIRPFSIPGDCYNFAPDNYLLTPQERRAAYGQLRHNLTDDISFRSEFVYNNRLSEQLLAAIPVTFASSGLFGTGAVQFDVSPDSYYNPFGVATTRVQRRLNETGGRSFSQDVDVWHYAGGFEGGFQLADRFFSWDVGYTFSQNRGITTTGGQVNLANVANAVGPSFQDAQGNLMCGTPGAPIQGCVPLNVFGGEGSITPEMLNYITVTLKDTNQYKRIGYTANITGDLFDMQGGTAAFAAGYEYRDESGFDLPDAFTASGLSSGNIRQPTNGGFKVDEAYVELVAPVFAGLPMADALELSLASRYSDYSTFGDTTNSKFGIKWKPIEDLVVRGNWSEGFRAPSISDLFTGNSDSFQTINDPCTGAGQATTNRFDGLTAEQQARCISLGASASGAEQASGQIRTTVGGNPNLTPEEATSKTFGFVYSPSDWLEGFDVSLDWWNIEIDNVVTQFGGQVILDACILGGSTRQCGLVTRLPSTGAVVGIIDTNANGAGREIEGYDLTANYRFSSSVGDFVFTWDTSYLSKDTIVLESGIPNNPLVFSQVGNYYGAGGMFNRIKSNLTMNWSMENFGATWGVRYRSHLEEDCTGAVDPDTQCSNPNGIFNQDGLAFNGLERIPTNLLGGTTYHDLQLRWSAPWNGVISGGVKNLFDKDPPVSISVANNSFDPAYDVPGRYYYLSYSQTF
ncbi:TonB-dependent receptor domain-containing protein [Pseudomarimonas arenosa]|uniref:TonB-dependent receptor n=1 Tax=Pseudomarimonas arenosa TaxID=2774145 RepID=A0AAW3ZTR2_9GAMM|nr:TonB-dependent receptor [Pseudomarimonas arenosa]MBD8528175.1 TonB-dependent receptor [Pseudomarimonas arenosa]